MLIEVQVMNQNPGNWEYTIKGDIIDINPDHIWMIKPFKGLFAVYEFNGNPQYPLYIDTKSRERIKYYFEINTANSK